MEGCHSDGNPSNNRLSNLRWDTRSANYDDARRHGTAAIGDRNAGTKLTSLDRARASEMRRHGLLLREIASEFGISQQHASFIVKDVPHG